MTLIQIRISHAGPILARMSAVLRDRKHGRVTRVHFLRRWGSLRRALAKTPEYQAFCETVRRRDDYKCVQCYRPARTVHHRQQVSEHLELVFEVTNGEVRCNNCHREEHPWMGK